MRLNGWYYFSENTLGFARKAFIGLVEVVPGTLVAEQVAARGDEWIYCRAFAFAALSLARVLAKTSCFAFAAQVAPTRRFVRPESSSAAVLTDKLAKWKNYHAVFLPRKGA